MLSKKYRFHGHNSLRFVYTKGSVVRSRFISLKFAKNSRRVESRLAVVVSKKVSKVSPLRNRMRRRLYEAARLRWSMVEPGYDIVLTVFDERVASMPSEELDHILNDLLQRAELLKS